MLSKMTVGKTSVVSKRSKAVPLESLFKSDVESVKARNERTGADNDAERFGRWAMRQEAEKAKGMKASNTANRLDPIEDIQRYQSGGPASRAVG